MKFKSLSISLFLLIFFIYLEIAFVFFVSGNMYGFYSDLATFSIIPYLEAKVIFFIILVFLRYSDNEFVNGLTYILMIFLFVPNAILFEFQHVKRLIFYSISFGIVVTFLLSHLTTFNFVQLRIRTSQTKILLLALITIFILPFVFTYGVKVDLNVFLFKNIYELREVASQSQNIFTNYALGPLIYVLLPLSITYSIHKKDSLLLFISIGILLYLFSVTAHKIAFFIVFVVIFFSIIKSIDRKVKLFITGILGLLILTRLLNVLGVSGLPEMLVTVRPFFLPALLNFEYFEFFADDKLYLSHSVLSSIFEYPFHLDPSHLIGKVYFNDPGTGANNGFIADGFMNFGLIGVIVNVFIFAILLVYYKSLNIDERYFGIFVIMIFVFNSNPLITSFITQGYWLLIPLSYLILKNTKSD